MLVPLALPEIIRISLPLIHNQYYYKKKEDKPKGGVFMEKIKNIEKAALLDLAKEITVRPGEVASKTLAQNEAVSVTLFAFSQGEEISTHSSKGDAMVTGLEGKGIVVIDGKEFEVKKGETIIMPANVPHAINARDDDFKMILVVIF